MQKDEKQKRNGVIYISLFIYLKILSCSIRLVCKIIPHSKLYNKNPGIH